MSEPIVLNHVTPQAPVDFQRSARVLRFADGVGLLKRVDWQPAMRLATPRELRRLLLVDDYIATSAHVSDPAALDELIADHGPAGLAHFPLHGLTTDSSRPDWRKFVRLHEILGHPADAIVWAVGLSELERGVTLEDYRSELAFLIESCLEHDKMPVLATVPLMNGWRREQLRPYALAAMELAAGYDVPVVDFYSASLKRQGITAIYGLPADHALSGTPNVKGRRWFLQQIADTVSQYNADVAATP